MKQTSIVVLLILAALMAILIPKTAVCSSEADEAVDFTETNEPTLVPETIFPDATELFETTEPPETAPDPALATDVYATPTDLIYDLDTPQSTAPPAFVLPATGGIGIGWYVIGGMALVLAGGILMKKKR